MGLQLIFVVETNKSCKSDWIYIKDTIDRFFKYDNAHTKFTPLYLGGRGNYSKKQREIKSYISQYASTSKQNRSKVIFCFDCDNYDGNPDDSRFIKEAQQYCKEHGYDFVWFCRDIEHVYLGKSVPEKDKKSESVRFKANKMIKNVEKSRLSADGFKLQSSNIMNVLSKHLEQKDNT